MGTSINLPTPAGGDWTDIKREINSLLGNAVAKNPQKLISNVIGASGGMAFPSTKGSGGGSASGLGGGGSGKRSGSARNASVGNTISSLAGFATALGRSDLGAALDSLGLGELRGRPAAEVVARIAEHIAGISDGLQQELLSATLRDALLDAAAIEGDRSYQNLDAALQGFLAREGVEGLVQCFLTKYVFDRVWTLIENHVTLRTNSIDESIALSSAVERGCHAQVEMLIDDLRAEGRFEQVDWFAPAGQDLGNGIVSTLEFRLRNPEPPE
ncbi:MAG: hypothetical protein R3E01_01770 [Pirellulaceae bacterium]